MVAGGASGTWPATDVAKSLAGAFLSLLLLVLVLSMLLLLLLIIDVLDVVVVVVVVVAVVAVVVVMIVCCCDYRCSCSFVGCLCCAVSDDSFCFVLFCHGCC